MLGRARTASNAIVEVERVRAQRRVTGKNLAWRRSCGLALSRQSSGVRAAVFDRLMRSSTPRATQARSSSPCSFSSPRTKRSWSSSS
jgi:hypothetical protein